MAASSAAQSSASVDEERLKLHAAITCGPHDLGTGWRVKNTFLEPVEPGKLDFDVQSKASSDPTSRSSSRSSSVSSSSRSGHGDDSGTESIDWRFCPKKGESLKYTVDPELKERRNRDKAKMFSKNTHNRAGAETGSLCDLRPEQKPLPTGPVSKKKEKGKRKSGKASSLPGDDDQDKLSAVPRRPPVVAQKFVSAMGEKDSHWSLLLPSMGSAAHLLGNNSCQPCAAFISDSCKKGSNCKYCHDASHKRASGKISL